MPTSMTRKPSLLLHLIGAVVCYTLAAILLTRGLQPVGASENPVQTRTMLNAQSTINTSGSVISSSVFPQCRESAVYVDWSTGVSAGVVMVETAYDANYAGTWATLSTVTFASTAPKEDIVQITGTGMALRTRISTAVSNGTVSTYFVCN